MGKQNSGVDIYGAEVFTYSVPLTVDTATADIVIAEVGANEVELVSITCRSTGGLDALLTSVGMYAGEANAVMIMDPAVEGLRANLNGEDLQYGWLGSVSLVAAKQIVFSITGTTGANVTFDIRIRFRVNNPAPAAFMNNGVH